MRSERDSNVNSTKDCGFFTSTLFQHAKKSVLQHARQSVSQILWIYLPHPSGKKPTENAKTREALEMGLDKPSVHHNQQTKFCFAS